MDLIYSYDIPFIWWWTSTKFLMTLFYLSSTQVWLPPLLPHQPGNRHARICPCRPARLDQGGTSCPQGSILQKVLPLSCGAPFIIVLPVQARCEELQVQPRGTRGESGGQTGITYDISNKHRLGYSEVRHFLHSFLPVQHLSLPGRAGAEDD